MIIFLALSRRFILQVFLKMTQRYKDQKPRQYCQSIIVSFRLLILLNLFTIDQKWYNP